MKIIRYADSKNATHYAIQHPDGRFERLAGCIYENLNPTGQSAEISKILAPVAPTQILCFW